MTDEAEKKRETTIVFVIEELDEALSQLKAAKLQDRSEIARNYAVAITDLEKVLAYIWYFLETEGDE